MNQRERLERIWQEGGVVSPNFQLGWLPEEAVVVPKVRDAHPADLPEIKQREGLVAVPRGGPPGSPRPKPSPKE